MPVIDLLPLHFKSIHYLLLYENKSWTRETFLLCQLA